MATPTLLNTLLAGVTNPMDVLFRLAYARGFFVEWQGNDIVMSENAWDAFKNLRRGQRPPYRSSDWLDLLAIMGDIVHSQGDRIVDCTPKFSIEKTYRRLFIEGFRPQRSMCPIWGGEYESRFEFFKKSGFPAKICTLDLEPFVAMYVKALSSITIPTATSCQGHDNESSWFGRNELGVELKGKCHAAFHAALWMTDDGLKQFALPWESGHRYIGSFINITIRYDLQTMASVFSEVIRAGQFIYDNILRFRAIREWIGHEITESDANLNQDELVQKMIEIVNRFPAQVDG